MRIKLTTLSENTTSRPATLGEEGLSILIETGTSVILLDTGQTTSVVHNAAALGVDLTSIDKIVLSHEHFDHTGGLRSVLQTVRRPIDIVCHPNIWGAKYAVNKEGSERFIGVPFQRAELESLGARFVQSRAPVELDHRIGTLGEVPMTTAFESLDSHLFVKGVAGLRQDDLLDDLAMVIDTDDGLVVVSGCAHGGIINTLRQAQKLTGVEKVRSVVGGSHLVGSSDERVWQTVASLKEMNVGQLGLCHCTSQPAAAIMAREFGEGFFFNNVGRTTEVEV